MPIKFTRDAVPCPPPDTIESLERDLQKINSRIMDRDLGRTLVYEKDSYSDLLKMRDLIKQKMKGKS